MDKCDFCKANIDNFIGEKCRLTVLVRCVTKSKKSASRFQSTNIHHFCGWNCLDAWRNKLVVKG